ncbi:capsule biosynthesis protein CapC [Pseudoalteromonas sp. C2R02]|uniref:tyrosine-protein phosphatase n=1 Tax=Pseudoalteromonas sp. C2R02 TaxID=2841565 RepID=UPI001C084870|nr:CpsB/CapC family capsule biosynthesis tyrosine phosphatase [Pseudoalteromonas sp. C2R02]MBU2969566.1 capsule biosynthesis protein CapC [Pseudoalteromonas sp. C2R02]
MIDIHSHLIPGIDDGARDKDESLSLFQIAEKDGIKRMVMTPHIHFGRFDNTIYKIKSEVHELKALLSENNINLDIAYAAEVRIDAQLLPEIEQGRIPFIGQVEGQKVLLLELPHSHVPHGCEKLIRWLTLHNIKPLIAHPERNRDILKAPEKIKQFQSLGCLFQLTASSLTGHFGQKVQLLSEKLLLDGVIDVVASDSHNIQRRPPILSIAHNKVTELLGEETSHKIFHQTPYDITKSLFR